jgi:hypothetical protein
MFDRLRSHVIPIVIAGTFFIVGFLPVANLLGLSAREVVLGLAAGVAGGLSVLLAVLWNEAKALAAPPPA